MRRIRWVLLVAVAVIALGVGLLRQFPTRADCRASGRVVDPTDRHCVAAGGYVQLREHVLFHTIDVLALAGVVATLGAVGYWIVRRARAPA